MPEKIKAEVTEEALGRKGLKGKCPGCGKEIIGYVDAGVTGGRSRCGECKTEFDWEQS